MTGICMLVVMASVGAAQRADTTFNGDSLSNRPGYWPILISGAATSILIHESAHIVAAIAANSRPTFGFDTFRPTIYSHIDAQRYPRRQFWFSSAGLDIQTVLDEAILDVPHHRGATFERGLLAGGLGTTIFYLTIGRAGSVSDIEFISRTRVMTKTQATLLYGSIASIQIWRISRNLAYSHFFIAPEPAGRLMAGLRFRF